MNEIEEFKERYWKACGTWGRFHKAGYVAELWLTAEKAKAQPDGRKIQFLKLRLEDIDGHSSY